MVRREESPMLPPIGQSGADKDMSSGGTERGCTPLLIGTRTLMKRTIMGLKREGGIMRCVKI